MACRRGERGPVRAAGEIHVFDATSQPYELLWRVGAASDDVWLLEWLPGSDGFVSVDASDEAVVWDITDRRTSERSFEIGTYAIRSAFLDDDRLSVAGTNLDAELWDVASKTRTGSLAARSTELRFAELAAGAARVASTSGVGVGYRVDDLSAGAAVRVEEQPDLDRPVELSDDGRMLVVSTDIGGNQEPRYSLVDLETGRGVVDVPGQVAQGAGFSPVESLVIVSTGAIREGNLSFGGEPALVAYDAATGAELARLEQPGYRMYEPLQFTPDGDRFAVGGFAGEVVVYDVEQFLDDPTRAEVTRTVHPGGGPTIGLAFGDDGSSLLATHSGELAVTAYDVDADMTERWSIETDMQPLDVTVHEGRVWLPALSGRMPGMSDSGVRLVGVPIEPSELADFARRKATREFTDAECETYLGGPCGSAGS